MSEKTPHPRGEIEIELGGDTYKLRPSFAAIAAIRGALGEPLLRTVRRFMEADFGPEDIRAIVAATIVDKKVPDNLGDLVYDAGMNVLGAKMVPFLISMCNGGRPGNAAAPAMETPAR